MLNIHQRHPGLPPTVQRADQVGGLVGGEEAEHVDCEGFVGVEVPRLRANKALYAFLQRYERVPLASGWQVYDLRHFATPGKP